MRKLWRVLTSRTTLSILFILLELATMAVLLTVAYKYYAAFAVITVIIRAAVFIGIVNREMNPEFKLTWLAVVFAVPLFGTVLYILFSKRYTTGSETAFLAAQGELISENKRQSGELELSNAALGELSALDDTAGGIAHALLSCDPGASLFRSGGVRYFPSGEELYADMLASLACAERFIFLEYFIIEDGAMWQGILDILRERVRAGVEVRVLYDDFGCISTLPADYDKRLRREGIFAYRFSRIIPTVSSSHNNRDHRKICVIDGKTAYTGGVNIADEYINARERFGHWKDGGVRVDGYAARGFTTLFLSLYDLSRRLPCDYSRYLPPITPGDEDDSRGFLLPLGSGPMPIYRSPVGKMALMNIIWAARRYLYITTPYLIIDYDLTEALRAAAQRGVDVRIITPGIPDKRLISIMTRSSYPRLISAGVRIFEYTPGFIHEKTAVCDDSTAIIGTVNLDYRSLVHHYEDLAVIFADPEIKRIRESVCETLGVCREITEDEAKLGLFQKAIRCLARIIYPLL